VSIRIVEHPSVRTGLRPPVPEPQMKHMRPLAIAAIAAASLTAAAAPRALHPSMVGDAAQRADTAPQFAPGWRWPAGSLAPTVSTNGMVVTTDRVASEVGAEILRRGGNAVDAAVATHFALAVVNPEAGNIGGGGFMIVRMADGTTAALDFRETAPGRATRDMFLDSAGNVTRKSLVGPLAAGVPGSVAGMWEAHKRFGSLPWADLVQPAVNLARGIVVHERLASSLQAHQSEIATNAEGARIFLPGGRAPRVGDRLVQDDLARTLERVAASGADGFYHGETARAIAAEMRATGGLIDTVDLARYRAIWRDPVRIAYRGFEVITMPPPSSGGATLAEMLNILSGYDLRGMGYLSAAHVHLFTEASRRAFADRNAYLADPDFVPQPVARMSSPAYAAQRRATIRPDRATPSAEVAPGMGPALREGTHTTHYSIVDAKGNAVAVTTTINSLYGNLMVVRGAGFWLNDEMDDFTAKPGVPNQFGLVQGAANAVAPAKRMLSAMTPTIVLDSAKHVRLVTGSPGGSTIITTVAAMVSNVIDFRMNAADAMAAPRLHHQHLPDTLRYERGGLTPATAAALRAMGHAVSEREGYQGDVQTIMVAPDGRLEGVSDPRRGGAAVGVSRIERVVQ
jgi:gamma-glutamyltranspeptidase/glutathione hydrolase